MLYGLIVYVDGVIYNPEMVLKPTLKEIYEEATKISEKIFKEKSNAVVETTVSVEG